jgi:hypothetical protein
MKNQPNSIFVLMLEADNLAKQQEILQMDDLNKEVCLIFVLLTYLLME